MIRNYLKIALNIIFANKLFSLINIFGLAVGIAWVTVGGTAARAANAKPVLALRYE